MPSRTPSKRELRDAYRFHRFIPARTIVGIFGAPQARIISLTRREKKPSAARAAGRSERGTTGSAAASGICPAGTCGFISSSSCAASTAGTAAA